MLSLRHLRSALRGLLLVSCTLSSSQTADFSTPVFRSTVSEVRVTFFATDERNHSIDTLKPEEFAVVDNERVVRNFRSFLHSDETALDVVALVDVSESVAPRLQVAIKDVLQVVSQEQAVADENISVLSFGGTRPAIVCSGNCRGARGRDRLLNVKQGGTTPLFDALVFGANFVVRRHTPGIRPVIVLFSDGVDTISINSLRDALTAVMTSGAVIYSVDLNPAQQPSSGSTLLEEMATATGGRYFRAQAGIANVLKAALEDLRASYLVTYQLPSREVGFHSLRLLPTHNLNLRFHSRNGYYYENA